MRLSCKIIALFCLCVLSAKAQTITHGGTYTTNSFFSIQTTEPVVMDHCTWLIADGQSVILAACQGANITIQNSVFTFIGSNPSTGQLLNCPNIWMLKSFCVHNCFFDGHGQTGIYIQAAYNTSIVTLCIYGNIFQNCLCAIGVANLWDDPNISIQWNQIGFSGPLTWTDQISIYDCRGLAGQEITVGYNYVQVDPNSPYVFNAGGLSLGDYGSMYVIGIGNISVDCTIGLWWPNNNTSKLLDNKVVGQGQNGTAGLAVFPNAGYAIGNASAWLSGPNFAFGPEVGEALNIDFDPGVAQNPYPVMFWLWQSELLAAHQTIGPQ